MEKSYLTVPFEFKSESIDDEYYTFEGYASTYGNVDLGDDIVMAGAFDNTLKTRKPSDIKILWQHNMMMPIGVATELRDDKNGFYIRAKMPKDHSMAKDAMALMKCGAVDSMSIGYIPTNYDYDDKGVRRLKEIDLREVSLVTMPMNPKALITAMKSAAKYYFKDINIEEFEEKDEENQGKNFKKFYVEQVKEITTKRQFEQCLRESGAFSVEAAKKLASFFNQSESGKETQAQFNELLEILKRN